jgi:hypothetical protein
MQSQLSFITAINHNIFDTYYNNQLIKEKKTMLYL